MKKITLLQLLAFIFITSNVNAIAMLPITGTLSPTIPTDWVYITNDSKYPDPSFYTTAGAPGLKLSFENQGVMSPEFDPKSEITVTLNVNVLNQNSKTGTNTNYFTITGLNASGETVGTAYFSSITKGNNSISLLGKDIVRIRVIMTGFPHDGTKYCNVNLASISITEKTSSLLSPTSEALGVSLTGKKITVNNSALTSVDIFNTVGVKVRSLQLENGSADLDLAKGIYIVKAANQTAKIRL